MKTTSQTAITESRVCCVTGGARGIGAAIVRLFDDAGFRVIFTYKSDGSSINATALERKGRVIAVKCDSSTESGADSLLAAAQSSFGRVDILINNAGSDLYSLVQDTSMDDYRRCMDDNLTSTFINVKKFAPHFISKKSGCIINMSSVWGETGGAFESVYSAAKAGVIGFTKSLAKELAPSGITVNCIAPGAVLTDMLSGFTKSELDEFINEIPLKRLGAPEDIAAAVLFLVNAKYITGQTLSVNGGRT